MAPTLIATARDKRALCTLGMVGSAGALCDLFRKAGMYTVGDARAYSIKDRRLHDAAAARCKDTQHTDTEHWRRVVARAINVIYRIKGAGAAPAPPNALVCPLSQAWLVDPVTTPSGHSYSRQWIEEWIDSGKPCPETGARLFKDDLRPNLALAQATEYHRMNACSLNIVA